MLVPVTPTVQAVLELSKRSPDAAEMLVTLGLYEALCDEADRIAPSLERDARAQVAKRAADVRRGLVRTYVGKRLAGEDVDDILSAAARLTLIEKAAGDVSGEARIPAGQPGGGRWTRVLDAVFTNNHGPGGKRPVFHNAEILGSGLTAHGQTGAGQLLSTAGRIGPEAERVLSPGIRRTAYRYRGTERTPKAEVQRDTGDIARTVTAFAAAHEGDTERAQLDPDATAFFRRYHAERLAATDRDNPKRLTKPVSPETGATNYWHAAIDEGRANADQARLGATADYLTAGLRDRVPDLDKARISLAAGQLPPSIGYIVDADGDVVSEAQGFNGDHYLPFDLANLKKLHGGGYVRTRTTGGPTDEDIYTGIMTGARQVTVVSHSGVFTVEFDPDLRGGRRYSDKARQMVDRYARLVNAIGSGELYQRQVPREQLKAMQHRAQTEAGILDSEGNETGRGDYKEAERILGELKTRYMASQKFNLPDDTELEERAHQAATEQWKLGQKGNKPSTSTQTLAQAQQEYEREFRAQRDAEAAKIYRLDGEGYTAALRSLQQEFPFFIRDVRTETWPDYAERLGIERPGEDRLMVGRVADIGHQGRGELASRSSGKLGATGEPGRDYKARGRTPAAAAATADLATALASPSSSITTGLGRALTKTLANSGLGDDVKVAADMDEDAVIKHPDTGKPMIPDNPSEATSDAAWFHAVLRKYPDGRAMATWLMGPQATPADLDKAAKVLKAFHDKGVGEADKPAWAEALAAVSTAQAAKRPFADTANPLELERDPKKMAPPAYPDVVKLQADVKAYDKAPDTDADIRDGLKELTAKGVALDPMGEAIPKHLNTLRDRYDELADWGGKDEGSQPDVLRADPENTFRLAQQVATKGLASDLGQQLSRQAKAWAWLRGRALAYAASGRTAPEVGGADPKAAGSSPPAEPPALGFIKRAPLPRFGPGSAVAKAYRARVRTRA